MCSRRSRPLGSCASAGCCSGAVQQTPRKMLEQAMINQLILRSRNQDAQRPNSASLLQRGYSFFRALQVVSRQNFGCCRCGKCYEKDRYRSCRPFMGSMSASAADLAARPYTKAPAPVVSVYNWGGFYIGGHVGGAWTNQEWVKSLTPPCSAISRPGEGFRQRGTGIFGGGHAATTGRPTTSCSVSRAPSRASTTAAPCSTPSSAPALTTSSAGVPTGWRRLPAVPVSPSTTTCSTSRAATPA